MNRTVDLHFYDTYYVVNDRILFWMIAVLLMYFAIIYRVTYRVLFSRYLIWIHLVLTLLTLCALMIFPFRSASIPARHVDLTNWTMGYRGVYSQYVVLAVIATTFIIAQLLFVVNVVGGLIKRSR
jgi:hypothetical protein